MDGEGKGSLGEWLIDAGAAALFAAAAGFAGSALLAPPRAAITASLGLAAALLFLRLVKAEPAQHRLAAFTLGVWPEPGDVAELTEPEPLLLEDVLTAAPDSRVVQLFTSPQPRPPRGPAEVDAPPSSNEPTSDPVQLPADASAALRHALADLRRSLR